MRYLLLAAASIAFGATAVGQATNYPNGSLVADFTVTDTHGNVHNLYSYTSQGKHVILDFFFDTCGPCQATSHYFSQLHETYGCNAGDIICIAMNNGTDTNAEVDAYESTYGGPWSHPPAIGIEGGCTPVDNAFGVNAYPTYCLIGPDNLMKNQDIWPLADMNTFVQAFPAGSNIAPTSCLVGIGEQGALASFSAYPVPSTGFLTLSLPSDLQGGLQTEVTDAAGRMVHSARIMGTSQTLLDLSELADGQYLVRVTGADGSTGISRIAISR